MFRILTLLSILVTFSVILFGVYVRLSGAGLGCPDWPGCYGQPVLSGSSEAVAQAQQAYPEQPLDLVKAWKEMGHRYAAAVLAALILLLGLFSWRVTSCRAAAVGASAGLIILLVLQAVLGLWAVKSQVLPVIVTAHLLLAFFTFWLLYWLYLRVNPSVVRLAVAHGPHCLAVFAMLMLVVEIALGAWTSSNYAALACGGVPRCNGSWWPDADYLGALNLFRHFSLSPNAALSGEVLVAIHWLHRIGAVATFLILGILSIRATQARYPRRIRCAGLVLAVMLPVQIALGAATVEMVLPMWIVLLHSGFAALLMLPLIYIHFYSRYAVPVVAVPPKGEALPPVEEAVEIGIPPQEEVYVEKAPETLYLRLRSQLKRTRSGLSQVLARIPLGQKNIDGELLEEIETSLIMADVGVDATTAIVTQLTDSVERHHLGDAAALTSALKQQLLDMLEPCDRPLQIPKQDKPFVILVVGVNGAGKTTTIGKLAKRLQAQGHSVMLAAGDTFRAAAVEQLQSWGERNGIHVVAQHSGADSASVIYDGVQSAYAKGIDILIADTAGRLHTKSNLMEELKKIKRIMSKLDDSAPHEVLLVLDAGTGQNAVSQARLFNEAVALTGIALTKLDGTAKGGVIFALAKQFRLPIRFIGVGEGIDDLQDFHAQQFVDALLAADE